MLQDIEYGSNLIRSHAYVNTKFQQRNLAEQMHEAKVEILLAKPTAREGKLAEEGPGRGDEG